MKRFMNGTPGFFLLVPLVFLACEGSLTPPAAQEVSQSPAVSHAGSMSDVAEFATGSFHTGSSGVWTTHSFHALRRVDGSVDGSFHVRRHLGRAGGAKVTGTVVCMVIQGNEAWVAGVAIKALGEVNIGRAYGFWVRDSGEGSAPPDEFAYPATGPGAGPGGWLAPPPAAGSPPDLPSAQSYCAGQPAPTTSISIEAGNIQIHGG